MSGISSSSMLVGNIDFLLVPTEREVVDVAEKSFEEAKEVDAEVSVFS